MHPHRNVYQLRRSRIVTVMRLAILLAFGLAPIFPFAPTIVPAVSLVEAAPKAAAPAPAAPTTNTLHLSVTSARAWAPSGLAQGQSVPTYRWLIVKDNTGDPSNYGSTLPLGPGNSLYDCSPDTVQIGLNGSTPVYGDPKYPDNCLWPSIHTVPGGVQNANLGSGMATNNGGPTSGSVNYGDVVAEGNQTNLNTTTGLTLDPGKYMITVQGDGFTVPGCTPSASGVTPVVTCQVPGFKIDGNWFTIPLSQPGTDPGLVNVPIEPDPLPLTTVRMKVFNDLNLNGTYDTNEPVFVGWQGHIDDIAGAVTDDYYGNPICTVYQHDASGNMIFDASGHPVVQTLGTGCFSDANGVITIPYLAQNRYSATVVPPNGQKYFQTSTLEGFHDWDIWAQEGWNGYDPEFIIGNEPFPFAEFGFTQAESLPGHPDTPTDGNMSLTGSVKGVVVIDHPFTPPVNGVPFGGEGGNSIGGPVPNPIVALTSNTAEQQPTYVAYGNADGTFQINHIPDGDYLMTYWDEQQLYLLDSVTIRISGGNAIDLGNLDAFPWFGDVHGKVCVDLNKNGKCDPGEPGIPNLTLNLLSRDNSLQDQGTATAITDVNGNYDFPQAYPLGQWVVEQAYFEQYYTVGVTYQTLNQPTETTVMANGGFVDVSTFNQVGQYTRFDWAVRPYETDPTQGPTTGGIVGEMVYNSTRIETDASLQSSQPNEGGIPGFKVHLYAPVTCTPGVTTLPTGYTCGLTTTNFGSSYYEYKPDGSLAPLSDGSGNPIDMDPPYTSETYRRPIDCTPLDVNGNPIPNQVVAPANSGTGCVEGPLMSDQVSNNSLVDVWGVGGDGQYVNGNYGFTQIDHDPTTGAALAAPITIPEGDWIVYPEVPNDPFSGKPLYRATMEEDVNIYQGNDHIPVGEVPTSIPTPLGPSQARTTISTQIPPFPCVGPQHTVNVVSDPTLAHFDIQNPSTTTGVYNPTFAANAGSPYQGQQMPLCNAKLVTVKPGRSATPNFYWQTTNDVTLPGRISGLVVDDLTLTINPKDLYYGEKAGIPNMPVGIYDFDNRLVTTVNTDKNGTFEVILPSSNDFNCPTPEAMCPGVYRFVANDPGQPGHLNPNYNPQYRTIAVFNQVSPGITIPADLAPVPVQSAIEGPGVQAAYPAQCLLNDPVNQPTAPLVPEFYAVNKPYVSLPASAANRTITIAGQYFGATQGTVSLDNTPLSVSSWADRQIVAVIPANMAKGPHQLFITGSDGKQAVNTLTFHVLGTGYNPTLFVAGPASHSTEVPAANFFNTDTDIHAIQKTLDAASHVTQALVVVYPGTPALYNPYGSHYENIIVHSPVKLQGVGPGGVYADGTFVAGTVLDGTGFGTDSVRDTDWDNELASLGTLVGPTGGAIPFGEVVLEVASSTTQFGSSFKASIDGMTIQGGDVADFVANINDVGGGTVLFEPPPDTTVVTQGGGIMAYAYTQNLQITNNIVRSNTGDYGGAIRLGTANVGSNNLANIRIAYNRILANGGSNLAGAIGIFNGANGYQIDHNDMCGNFSAEYGGAISHYGLSPNSSIHDNRIWFNQSYDEGGGIMIAGEASPTLSVYSAGAGPVNIYNNYIQGNESNDDGGGLRFLEAGTSTYNVYNNMIVNNVSTHEGGGVSIDDAPYLNFYNNTVIRNITTATSITSNGVPAPAGLSTGLNSDLLNAMLPPGSPNFSNPNMFNNIFWDNRAGSFDGNNITGIGGQSIVGVPDPNPINYWDMANVDNPAGAPLSPAYSILHDQGTNAGENVTPGAPGSNIFSDPLVNSPYDLSVVALAWHGDAHFVGSTIVAVQLPATLLGDYHLSGISSPANNAGISIKGGVNAPAFDIDNEFRPSFGGYEIGADEINSALVPFPQTPVLDNFNRANGAVGANWFGNTSQSNFRILSNQLEVRDYGQLIWHATAFGGNQEAYFTFVKLSTQATMQGLVLKAGGLSTSGQMQNTSHMIQVYYNPSTSQVIIRTYAPGQGYVQRGVIQGVGFGPGDVFGARATQDGMVLVYQNGNLLGGASTKSNGPAWPATYNTHGGRVGTFFSGTFNMNPPRNAILDDFGGGNVGIPTPVSIDTTLNDGTYPVFLPQILTP